MLDAMKRDRVYGFLDVKNKKIVNGRGEEIILTGWGLGNWLLCEGYMWKSHYSRFNRPRNIEAAIKELTGSKFAKEFWNGFRDNYITENDFKAMAEQGYNSVRIPIDAALFMEEEPELIWKEEGFYYLERAVNWCEKYNIYAFIDLHAAPGGQTGANIDNSIDDVARLFTDRHNYEKAIKLWEKLAEIYKDRWIVGGYDLLNEPLRPAQSDDQIDQAYLAPQLKAFYKDCIAAIRKIDDKHIFTLESYHWSTEPTFFDEEYDDKAVIHFHRYACLPDISAYTKFMEVADKLNRPLWLGETGENVHEWFTALYPLAAELSIGYNIWPWKKMDCLNSPNSVIPPENWDKILTYAGGGVHPGYEEAQKILTQYLENMKIENCEHLDYVHDAVFRRPGAVIRATDFDELPGKDISYHCEREIKTECKYRANTGMEIYEHFPNMEREFGFDCMFRKYTLALNTNEFAQYFVYDVNAGAKLDLSLYCGMDSAIAVYQDEKLLGEYDLRATDDQIVIPDISLNESSRSEIKVITLEGRVELEQLITRKE